MLAEIEQSVIGEVVGRAKLLRGYKYKRGIRLFVFVVKGVEMKLMFISMTCVCACDG